MGMAKAKAKKSYNASDIEVLEGLEPVRKRPGMYIAGTDTPAGLHQLVFEILDNSVDEAMNGHASQITVVLHEDSSSITVKDNGRGIPVDKHPKFKKSALEIILTTLHAGGKFSNKNYKTAGGLHGVGSSVVNALSEEMLARVTREGKIYEQKYSRGKALGPVKTVSKKAKGSGTEIFFRPDPQIFPKTVFSAKKIRETMQIKAYLNAGLKLNFEDHSTSKAVVKEEYYYKEGLQAYLNQLLEEKKSTLVGGQPFFLEKNEEISVTVAFAWTESTTENFYSYVNGIYTPDGGSHENGAKSGIVKAVRNYINVHDIALKGAKVTAEDIREGLVCLVSVKLPGEKYQPQFQGQTKDKLNNPEIAPLVDAAVRSLEQLLNEKPNAAEEIVGRIILSAKARAASRAAAQSVKRKIGISHRLTLPGKLADCQSSKSKETELFIVEGDSAGGSTKQGRDRKTQAVLPLRGKVLNTISNPKKKITDNKELSNIISALGCGAGEAMQIDKLRYGKVIILTDADADGMHIATLLLAFFFTHMRPLIESGALYIGKPPLYGVFPRGSKAPSKKSAKDKKSKKPSAKKKVHWVYSDKELDEVLSKNNLSTARIVRYKGLGEMNPETLWSTTLDPEDRTLLRVGIDDQQEAAAALQDLMGTDPMTRYKLICDNADKIELDV